MALNNIIIQGRMVKDAELRQTGNGIAVTSFTLAVDRDRKEQDGSRKADFIDVNAWRQSAEFVAKYGGKGRMLLVEGKLHFRDWTDKDGNNRRSAEVVADNIYFCDSKRESDAPAGRESFAPIEEFGECPF